GVPSQPSIGWMQKRLPAVSGPTVTGVKRGAKSSAKRRSVPSRSFSASRSAVDLYLKKRAKGLHRARGGRAGFLSIYRGRRDREGDAKNRRAAANPLTRPQT